MKFTSHPSRLTLYAALAIVTIAVYVPAFHHQFISLDDLTYIVTNEHVNTGLGAENIRWAFTSVYSSNWHPLTWISHMIDVELFGLDHPGGHHGVNVVLHVINTLLLFSILLSLTSDRRRSALVAALFALHPMHVESVAWISERKDVLCTLFGFAAMRAYVGYVKKPDLQRYVLVFVLFALSLLSKAMFVTLPCVLLLLDVWPLRRLSKTGPGGRLSTSKRVFLEKLPLFALAFAISIATLKAQTHGGAVVSIERQSIPMRVAHTSLSYTTYLQRLAVPTGLTAFYDKPARLNTLAVSVSIAVLIFTTALAWWWRRRYPWLLVGWLWFGGMLVPVIGLVTIGGHFIADRYTYVPAVGLFIALAWSLRGRTAAVFAIVIVIGLGALTFRQVGHWRDTLTLFTHALKVAPDSYRANLNMAIGHFHKKQYDLCERYLLRAADLNPRSARPWKALGTLYELQGDLPRAVHAFQREIIVAPQAADSADHNNLGYLLGRLGRTDEAAAQFERAIQLDPNNAVAVKNLNQARRLLEAAPQEE